MEQSKIIENHQNLPADKMKAPSAYGEIKELISYTPANQEEVLKKEQGIPIAEGEPEAPATVPNANYQEQKLNETVPVKPSNTEQNHIKFQKEESNPKENSTETSLKSQTQTKEKNGAEEPTAEKNETSSNLKTKPPIEDHPATGGTESAQKQKDSNETKSKKQPKKDKPKDTKDKSKAPKKSPITEAQEIMPELSAQESKKKNANAKEIKLEEEKRQDWRSLLTEVSLVSSLSTFKLLYDKSAAPQSADASVRKRSAKQLYKKKLQILRENYTYRLGLLKQLKEAMRDKYNSEAQQLYSEYTSAKNKHKHGYLKNTDIHSKDSDESKVTDPIEDPVALATLG
ncbi:neurofilament heavy polypeptide [Drosophila serrata]|uniref:neurofilament heavy polypeptide n=1 Tax=Drosophila serrata TaxID=7274 RepID=UPI000A1D23D9|nr:neurofilament heavy polypeptide [Drosophila serrata]